MNVCIETRTKQIKVLNPLPPGHVRAKQIDRSILHALFEDEVQRNNKLVHLVMLAVVPFLCLSLLSACSKAELTDAEYVEAAKSYYNQADYKATVIELKNALAQNPDNAEARLFLGSVYVELGDGASAEKELRRAQDLGVGREGIFIPLAESLLLQGKYEQIITEIQPQGSLSATDMAEVYALLGKAYIGNGKLDEAANTFGAAFEFEPNLTSAQAGQAHLALLQGDLEDARSWINKSLASNSESAEAWSLLGNIELQAGNAAEAEAAFSGAIKLREHLGSNNIDIGKRALARVQLAKYAEAQADIETLRRGGFKDHPMVNYIAGLNYFKQGKYPEAVEALEASYNQNPSFLPAEYYLAVTHYLMGNLGMADEFARRVQAKAPKSLAANRLLGSIQIRRAEYDAAVDVLSQAERAAPDDKTILSLLATASLLEGDAERGGEYYQRLAALEPDSSQAKYGLMLAKLIDGQALEPDTVDDSLGQGLAEDDDYTGAFLRALGAFKEGKIGDALERAQRLHERYPDKVEPLNLVAACYLATGQWNKAKIELERVLALEPNEGSATVNLAKLEVQDGNHAQAQTRLEALLKENPQHEQASLLLADIQASLGNQEASISVLEQGLEHSPDALSLRTALAGRYLNAGRSAKVLEVTSELTNEQLQEQPGLLELRGKAQTRLGDQTSARHSFKRWTELAPDSAPAHYNYANSLSKSGDKDGARQQLDRAVQVDAYYLPARVGEIKMLVHEGEVESARKRLKRLKQDFGDHPAVLGIEGWFALGTLDLATAEKSLSAAIENRPTTDSTILLHRTLMLQQKQDEAIALMQNWLKTHPRDLAVLIELAGSYLNLNREEDARAQYARVVELYPNHVTALNNLAWLSRDKYPKQALGYVERAYELQQDDPYVLDTYGMLLMDKDDFAQGLRMIERAAERLPEDTTIQLHLGQALIKNKQFSEAKTVLSTLIEKGPDSESAKEAKAFLESMPKQ